MLKPQEDANAAAAAETGVDTGEDELTCKASARLIESNEFTSSLKTSL